MEHAKADSEAVAAALRGDRDAFVRVVEGHQEIAFRVAYLIVRDASSAEDVAQEAFVRAYQHLSRFHAGEPFRPWILRIVTNLALNHVRARTRRHGLLDRFTRLRSEAAPARPDEVAEATEEAALVHRAINELPEADRVVLYLRHFLDLSERDIAVAIGRPAGTVKSRLHRAGARLRDVIDQRYPSLRPGDGGGPHA